MTHDAPLLLLIIALGATLSPAVGRRLGIPAAVVEILFGLAIRHLGLAEGGSAPFVRFLADLGFALFLFLAGMEVDAGDLRRGGAWTALGPALLALASFSLALAPGLWMPWSPWAALALSATSVPLLLSVVREQGLTHSALGRQLLTLAAVGEVVTVTLVAVAEVFTEAEGALQALGGLARLLIMLAAVVMGTRAIALLRWWYPERVSALYGRTDSAETGVRAGFLLTFAMIAAAALAGVEPLLGAFVGGLMVSFSVSNKHLIEQKFGAMAYGFFVPVFFINVGLRLDLGADLLQQAPKVAGLSALMLACKVIPNLAWLVVGRSLRMVLVSALLLAAPLTLVIAIADLAARLGLIDENLASVLVLAGMLSSLVYPSLARRLLGREA